MPLSEDKQEEQSIEAKEVSTSTAHDHYYLEGVTRDLKEAICNCGHGIQINPSIEIKDGRILWNK